MRATTFLNVHLVSDSTGETLNAVLRAVAPLFEGVTPLEHSYYLVRSRRQLDRVLAEIESAPGVVLFTIASHDLRDVLEARCRELGIPALGMLDAVVTMLGRHLGMEAADKTGSKNMLDENYFRRIDALNYAMTHDDGQMVSEFEEAEVVLVGVSRTSKTPTSIYLANRGVRTANYPLVPKQPIPPPLLVLRKPLVVGLKVSPDRLIAIRRNRLLSLNADTNAEYVDEDAVREEVTDANRLFERQGWAVIDVTRRSIEETAAAVLNLLTERGRATG
jgi:[pyruvate, water dikinase]-phosphate phosphotransferase / [pyruvate, water dikinase] kinase